MIKPEKLAALRAADQSTIQPRYLRPAEAASHVGVGRSSLYVWMEKDLIKTHKVGSSRLVDRESLEAFIAGHPAA